LGAVFTIAPGENRTDHSSEGDNSMDELVQSLNAAVSLHRAGKSQQAEQAYRQILEKEPECADAWHLLGVLTCQLGRHHPAAGYIGHAIGLNPRASSYYNSLGVAYRSLKNLDDALLCYRRALELKPDNVEVHNNLGVLQRELGQLDEAAASYRRAVELKSDYAEAHNNLGIVLMDQDNTTEAEKSFARALEIRSEFPEAINNLGLVFLMQKKIEDAAACAWRALELKPNYPEAHKTLGDTFRLQGKIDDAIACYRLAIEEKPDYAEALNNLGILLMNRSMPEDAAACYRRALESDPEYVEALNNLGIALKMHGDVEGAIASYRRAIEILPNYAEAYNNLANALLARGDVDEAEADWQRAVELNPKLADAYGNLGMMLYEKGRIPEAAEVLKKWLEHDPANPIARHMAAAFSGEDTPARAHDDFVRFSFDHFARTFEEKLKKLEYHAPELVAAEVGKSFGEPKANLEVIDAGCGTGWCGPLLRPYARRLVGVDLSSAMLEKAKARTIYDELVEAELTAYFQEQAAKSCDLVASADTLVYFGDLLPITKAVADVLRPGGWFIFTIERAGDDIFAKNGFFLQPHGRYCHNEDYVRHVLQETGLMIGEISSCVLRMELGKPVQGMLVSACRPK
jgi:predicted TPR repeat methyltransferase